MISVKCEVYEAEGVQNLRDLGGYKIGDHVTVKRRFLRSASLSELTENGKQGLKELGVDCVIDLRSTHEVNLSRDTIIGYPGIHHESVPMLDSIFSSMAHGGSFSFPSSMSEMYIGLLKDGTASIAHTFKIFAKSYQTILFHCTAGKDRTGLIAMLLLGLARVDEETIIEDYSYTEILMGYDNRPHNIPEYLFRSQPENMRATLDFINVEYGGILQYLLKTGISAGTLNTIKNKLLAE